MNTTIVSSQNGVDLLRVKPNLGGRHFYCIQRGERVISRTYETLRVARKALRLFANNSPYPIVPDWLKTNLEKFGHTSL